VLTLWGAVQIARPEDFGYAKQRQERKATKAFWESRSAVAGRPDVELDRSKVLPKKSQTLLGEDEGGQGRKLGDPMPKNPKERGGERRDSYACANEKGREKRRLKKQKGLERKGDQDQERE